LGRPGKEQDKKPKILWTTKDTEDGIPIPFFVIANQAVVPENLIEEEEDHGG
jgi:hypothetical protein